jgi:putative transposase
VSHPRAPGASSETWLCSRVVDAERLSLQSAWGSAFIESWFGKLKEREVWLNEYETIDDARQGIGGYVARYHHRPHSGLNYRTPDEVRRTWEDLPERRKQAA